MEICLYNHKNLLKGKIFMEKEIENFSRKVLFERYNERTNPFLYLTTELDVTNIVEYCKIHKNFYATFGYLITRAANQIDAFKFRAKDGKFFYCDRLVSNYTQQIDGGDIGFFRLPDVENFDEYILEYKKKTDELQASKQSDLSYILGEVWLSCFPWENFTSLITPFDKSITIPQFIWDKFTFKDGKYFIHLMISAHHGFVDGGHVGEFLNILKNQINEFPGNV